MSSKFLVPLHLSVITTTPSANAEPGFVKVYVKNNYLKYLNSAGVETDIVLARPLDGFVLPGTASPVLNTDTVLSAFTKIQQSLSTLRLTGDVTGSASYVSGILTIQATITNNGITPADIANWNLAYSWGNHATAGYLTTSVAASTYVSLTGNYTNPTWINSLAWSKITGAPSFITTETDPVFTASAAAGITGTNISTWNTAYGWGNHASAGYQLLSEKGVANGYASLDSGGKVPVSQLPSSLMEYKGVWNASTNAPNLIDGTGNTGDVYRVSVAGTRNLGSGSISFEVGDYVIYNGTTWEKSDTTDAVASVNGFTGNVVLTTANITENTNLYYTDLRARNAISLTTTGTSGAATYNNVTGVLNIPDYSVTADNGVSIATGNIIQLGAANNSGVPLASNRWINTASNYLTVRGNSANQTLVATNYGTGYAFTADAIGPVARLLTAPVSANSIATVLSIARATSGTATAGIGSALEFENQTTSNGMYVSGRIASVLTNTSSTPSSSLQFDTLNAGLYNTALTLEATGRAVFNKYGIGTFTGTNAYFLAVTASGQMIEIPAASVGGSLTVGTTPVSSGTVGRIFFQGTGNVLSQSANLFWDIANDRLSIGAPTTALANLHINHPNNSNTFLRIDRANSQLFAFSKGSASQSHTFQTYAEGGSALGEIGIVNDSDYLSYGILGTIAGGPTYNVAGIVFSSASTSGFGNPSFLFRNIATANYATYAGVIKPALIRLQGTHGASSGSGEYAAIRIQTTINQTGGTGINYGIIYEPVVTSITGAHYGLVIRPSGTFNGIGLTTSLPTATWHVRGSGSSNATTSLLVENSTGGKLLMFDDSGQLGVNIAPTAYLHVKSAYDGTQSIFKAESLSATASVNFQSNGVNTFTFQTGGKVSIEGAVGSGETLLEIRRTVSSSGGFIFRSANSSYQEVITTNGEFNIGTTDGSNIRLNPGAGRIFLNTQIQTMTAVATGYQIVFGQYASSSLNHWLSYGYNSSYGSILQAVQNGSTPANDTLSLNPFGGNVGVGAINAIAQLHVKSSSSTTGSAFKIQNSNDVEIVNVYNNKQVAINSSTPVTDADVTIKGYQADTGWAAAVVNNINEGLYVHNWTGTFGGSRITRGALGNYYAFGIGTVATRTFSIKVEGSFVWHYDSTIATMAADGSGYFMGKTADSGYEGIYLGLGGRAGFHIISNAARNNNSGVLRVGGSYGSGDPVTLSAMIKVDPTYNWSATANIALLDYNPTVTSLSGGVHYGALIRPLTRNGIGLGTTLPTAQLHIAAGTATANTAPIKLTSGTALTTPEDGAFEYHSSHLYFTIGSTRYQLDQQGGGPGGPGTVTDVSIVTANGFAGTVATSSSTPAITISTTVTGLLKGNGTAISAAVAGTDYVIPSALSSYLPLAGGTLTGSLTTGGDVIITAPGGGSIEFYPTGGSTATYSTLKARLGSGLAPTLSWYGDVSGSYKGYGIYGPDNTYDGLLIYRETGTVVDVMFAGANQISLPYSQKIAWASGVNSVGTLDTGIARNAAGVIEINNGTIGTYRSLILLGATVTGLSGTGTRMVVADATGVLGTQAIPSGSSAYNVTAQTSNYTVSATSGTAIVKGDTSGGTFTVTLPTAVGNTATIIVKKTAGTAALVIDGAGSETIDGGLTASLIKVNESLTLISDNANWQII